jgi:beta-mannosidase
MDETMKLITQKHRQKSRLGRKSETTNGNGFESDPLLLQNEDFAVRAFLEDIQPISPKKSGMRALQNSNRPFFIENKNQRLIRKSLHENWTFKGPKNEKLSAKVPGCIHLDLLKHGLIPNPHVGKNEEKVLWVEQRDWVYSTTFDLPELNLKREWFLVFEGLDTLTEIRFNGKLLAKTNNMFRTYRLELPKPRLKGNHLEIAFLSPTREALKLEKKHGHHKQVNTGFDARQQLRKAACSYNWDWGLRLATSGIWKNVWLEGRVEGPFIKDWSLDTVSVSAKRDGEDFIGRAVLRFSGEILGLDDRSKKFQHSDLLWVLRLSSGKEIIEKVFSIGAQAKSFYFDFARAKLWMPLGYGKPHLYDANLTLRYSTGEVLDSIDFRFGVRHFEIEEKKDRKPHNGKLGRGFLMRVNGVPIWARGSNFIPVDSLIPRDEKGRTEKLVQLAMEQNNNMIRVWGGGVYESDTFYDLCDEKGILVWQDFAFACGFYPEYPAYAENVRKEAEDNIRRLRHHASLAVWCGNNEIETGFLNWPGFHSPKPGYIMGSKLWRKVIPDVLKALDPERPYRPSSPFGTGNPNAYHDGDVHWWQIQKTYDYRSYRTCTGRFVSEFGLQGAATLETWKAHLSEGESNFLSDEMEFHQRAKIGQFGLLKQIVKHFDMRENFSAMVHLSQVFQGEGVKLAVEHWRSLKGHTSGALYWQLNDVWPATSWAAIDSELRPKALHFYAKRVFEPVLLAFVPASLEKDTAGIKVVVLNDSLRSISGEVRLREMDFHGNIYREEIRPLKISENGKASLAPFHPENWIKKEEKSEMIVGELIEDGKIISRNIYFHVLHKNLNLPQAKARVDLNEKGLEVSSDTFVKGLWLHSDEKELPLMDNYLELLPGEKRFIAFRSGEKFDKSRKINSWHLGQNFISIPRK